MWSVMLADFTGGAQYPLRLYGHCMDRILNIKHISTTGFNHPDPVPWNESDESTLVDGLFFPLQ